MGTIYRAGRRWRTPRGEKRRTGDIIEEANSWNKLLLERLVSQKVLTEHPECEWKYYATHKWRCNEGKTPGDLITSVTDSAMLNMLVRQGFLVRIDSADEKKRGRPKGSKNKNSMVVK